MKTLQSEVEQLNQALVERDQLEEKRLLVIQEQAEAKAENPLLKGEMDELKGRIEQLESTDGAACPLCGQPLSPDERSRLIEELTEEGTQKGDKYRANVNLLSSVTEQVNQHTEALKAFDSTEQNLRDQTRLLDQTSHQINTLESQQAEWDADGKNRLSKIMRSLIKEDFAKEARATLAEIDAELKEIGYDAASHDDMRKKEAEMRPVEHDYLQLQNAHATLAPLEREIKEIQEQL